MILRFQKEMTLNWKENQQQPVWSIFCAWFQKAKEFVSSFKVSCPYTTYNNLCMWRQVFVSLAFMRPLIGIYKMLVNAWDGKAFSMGGWRSIRHKFDVELDVVWVNKYAAKSVGVEFCFPSDE